MSDLPPSPGDTLGIDGPDAAPDVDADPEGGAKDILDLLLHTEPDVSPADIEGKMGVGPASSNAIVGVRKMLHGATGRGGGAGTPALVNFGAAAYHAVGGLDETGDARDATGATDEDVAAALDGLDIDGEY